MNIPSIEFQVFCVDIIKMHKMFTYYIRFAKCKFQISFDYVLKTHYTAVKLCAKQYIKNNYTRRKTR